MKTITLKSSTVAAMSKAYNIYSGKWRDAKKVDPSLKDEGFQDYNSFILMCMCENIVKMTGGTNSKGEFIQSVINLLVAFKKLDDD